MAADAEYATVDTFDEMARSNVGTRVRDGVRGTEARKQGKARRHFKHFKHFKQGTRPGMRYLREGMIEHIDPQRVDRGDHRPHPHIKLATAVK